MRKITQHIVHCSASDFGDVAVIRQWHLARGWRDIGYHFVIRVDGAIEVGRPLEMIGAHVKGHNRHSIGTCLIGNTTFALVQFEALRRLHKSLQAQFAGITVHGHRDFTDSKTCPNFEVGDVL